MNMTPYLEFWGATGTVTGSKYILSLGEKRILIDCGLFQGEKEIRRRNWTQLPFDLSEIDAVILTHAHIDHSGYIPLLVKRGFKGPVYCTEATRDLCAILLPDSGYLQEKHAERANRKGYTRHDPAKALYTERDGQEALSLFKPYPFHKTVSLGPGLNFKFLRAGHILGAAIISLKVNGRHIIFSGDLGRQHSPTMRSPDCVQDVDYLILESTYGDKVHSRVNPEDALADIINVVSKRGGTLVVPCFAVGRTQTLLYYLSKLKRREKIPDMPVFLDSPMAINASELFCRHPLDHLLKEQDCPQIFDVATYVRTVDASKALTVSPFPKIILSASGMATGGRVLHHLKSYIGDPNSAIVFTGFQAQGTRGDALVNGADKIRIHGRNFDVKADIHQLDMLSAHADSDEIVTWLKTFNHSPNHTFLTHGEPQPAQALKEKIGAELHWPVTIPEYGQRIELN